MLSGHLTRARGGLLLLALLVLSSGCGPSSRDRAKVRGKVTYDGKPLTAGAVTFFGKDNQTGSGTINTEGYYAINDAPIGDVKITVTVPRLPPGGMSHLKGAPTGPVMPGQNPNVAKRPSKVVPIPQKYSKLDTSGLTYTVEKGEHTKNIDLPK